MGGARPNSVGAYPIRSPSRSRGPDPSPGGPSMFAPHLSRLLTVGLAACAVTWALAATALAGPGPTPPYLSDQANRPGYKYVAGDQKEPQSAERPAFKYAPGDVKEPQSAARPAFTFAPGD